MNWYEIVPAFLSAVAAIAAAIAAIYSLRINTRSIALAESTALASHHNSASSKYFEIVRALYEATEELNEISYKLRIEWAKEIELKDERKLGGCNPRPLRHVLSDSSEMLASYGMNTKYWGPYTNRAILSVIRDGLGEMTDQEYQMLLDKADGQYQGFEGIFGTPSKTSRISLEPAFRFACYQLMKRVKSEEWGRIWKDAWLENGWLSKYKSEYLKVKPVFENARNSLMAERSRLGHSSFPLSCNTELSNKYDELLNILHHLIEDSDSESLEDYKDWDYEDEQSILVLCSMAVAWATHKQLDFIYIKAN